MPPSTQTFNGKSVWLSGVSGFKGTWLAEWLLMLGAKVHGFSLPPPTAPALFEQTDLASRITWDCEDIRDAVAVKTSLLAAQPDFVFHLAAQPLVRLSYSEPVETWDTNVMGTIHVLEALRHLKNPCAAVLITTDKCYENREWLHGYREEDPLGGYDPYSSSKAAAEIAIASWRRSFFPNHPVRIASARAGNVIGGGDWATDRIVPDCIRALQVGNPIPVRNKSATRPWQHVLEPLSGYLTLAAHLSSTGRDGAPSPSDSSAESQPSPASGALKPGISNATQTPGADLTSAFNFGPNLDSNRTVADIVQEILKHWPGEWLDKSDPNAPHEAGKLNLATDKAFHLLSWRPRWNFSTTIEKTVGWYRSANEGADPGELTRQQIKEYSTP